MIYKAKLVSPLKSKFLSSSELPAKEKHLKMQSYVVSLEKQFGSDFSISAKAFVSDDECLSTPRIKKSAKQILTLSDFSPLGKVL